MSAIDTEDQESLVSLRPLLVRNADKIEVIRAKLAILTREEVFARLVRDKISIECANELGRAVNSQRRIQYWLLNQECTRRGIPPIIRNLPMPNDDDKRQIADAVAIDMEWLAVSCPMHHIPQPSWRPVLRQTTLHDKSLWIANQYPRIDLHMIARRLGLSEAQQREMHFVKRRGLMREADKLDSAREETRAKLASAYYARDSRYRTEDGKATISRRLEVWHMASLVGWKPTQTARFYEAKTGKPLTRQMAANIITQIRRDLPECGKVRRSVKDKED